MAYIAAINEAKGMLYYMGGSAGAVEGYKDAERPWGYLNELVPELAGMIPVFTAPAAKDKVEMKPGDSSVCYVVKELDGHKVIVAANKSDKAVDAVFSAQGLFTAPVTVRFENRSITPGKGIISDHFGTYGVHIYEVR
jgi:hypothetical protein